MAHPIPTLDLHEWRSATGERRAHLAHELDVALRETGMFLLAGHDVPPGLTNGMREAGHEFMRLDTEQKRQYVVGRPYDSGWRGLGVLQASAVGDPAPASDAADLHEAFHIGPQHRTGDRAFDEKYYPGNKWPTEVPRLREVAEQYTERMAQLSLEILDILATTLGLAPDHFTSQAQRATWTQNINWYPSLAQIGRVQDGQMRVGPHTDFGTITLLDRQRGVGSLEVWNDDDDWFTPPFRPDTLVVNLGDMMNQWTDGRWRALRHRVLAPPSSVPDEELVSLVFFFEADPDAWVQPLPAPAGGGEGQEPVIAGESIMEKVGETVTLGE